MERKQGWKKGRERTGRKTNPEGGPKGSDGRKSVQDEEDVREYAKEKDAAETRRPTKDVKTCRKRRLPNENKRRKTPVQIENKNYEKLSGHTLTHNLRQTHRRNCRVPIRFNAINLSGLISSAGESLNFLSGFQLPWPPSCCLYRTTPKTCTW